MADSMWMSGKWVVVLCHLGTLVSCGGSATEEKSDDPGAGTGGIGTGSTGGDGDSGGDGDGDFVGDGDGDGDDGTGGVLVGTGGTGDPPIACGDIAYPVGTIILVGAPVADGACLASVEITGTDQPPEIECYPLEDGCSCMLWSGSLIEGTNTIMVLDEDGAPVTAFSGPYPPAQSNDPCGGPLYETIEIDYQLTSPTPQIGCERSGIVEFCGPGEGCCNCGCGVVTDSCLQEVVCPAHEGPLCGLSQCREGTICCDADAARCAESVANCPD